MNCKPGQRAMIVRGARLHPCVALRVGVPVKVARLVVASGLIDALREALDGPTWVLEEPLHCPSSIPCVDGICEVPDACLKPFDDNSLRDVVQTDEQAPVGVEVLTEGVGRG